MGLYDGRVNPMEPRPIHDPNPPPPTLPDWRDYIAPKKDDGYGYRYGTYQPHQPAWSTPLGVMYQESPLYYTPGGGAPPEQTGQATGVSGVPGGMLEAGLAWRDGSSAQGATPEPTWNDTWGWLSERGPNTGGSAGYDNRGAVAAYFDQMRQQAATQYGGAQTDLTQVYDQLASMIQPMAAQTAAAYGDAIGAGADQSEALIAATQERINAEAATRAAAFAELGISGGGELSDTAMEAERGMSDIGANAANWGGLMGAFSTGQQSRMNQDYVGAGDAKVMAIEDLVSRYQDYLRMLDQSETDQMATAYQPGSAGTPGKMQWEQLGSTGNKLLEQSMVEAGLLPGPTPEAPYVPKAAQDFDFLVQRGEATREEILYMLERKNLGMPGDPTNPLYNPLVEPYL